MADVVGMDVSRADAGEGMGVAQKLGNIGRRLGSLRAKATGHRGDVVVRCEVRGEYVGVGGDPEGGVEISAGELEREESLDAMSIGEVNRNALDDFEGESEQRHGLLGGRGGLQSTKKSLVDVYNGHPTQQSLVHRECPLRFPDNFLNSF